MRHFRSFLGLAAVMLAAPMAIVAGPIGGSMAGSQIAVMPRLPKKQVKAVKRLKHADPDRGWSRSRNRPPKRKLHRNLVAHGRRVRRARRRARKAA